MTNSFRTVTIGIFLALFVTAGPAAGQHHGAGHAGSAHGESSSHAAGHEGKSPHAASGDHGRHGGAHGPHGSEMSAELAVPPPLRPVTMRGLVLPALSDTLGLDPGQQKRLTELRQELWNRQARRREEAGQLREKIHGLFGEGARPDPDELTTLLADRADLQAQTRIAPYQTARAMTEVLSSAQQRRLDSLGRHATHQAVMAHMTVQDMRRIHRALGKPDRHGPGHRSGGPGERHGSHEGPHPETGGDHGIRHGHRGSHSEARGPSPKSHRGRHHEGSHSGPNTSDARPGAGGPTGALQAPGDDIFGAVQEAARMLEQRPDTRWAQVDLEALRQHLLDMRSFTAEVEVASREEIEGGLTMILDPRTARARSALKSALTAHAEQLRRELGWEIRAEPADEGDRYRLTATDPTGAETEKIRALGYIGLMTQGTHHRRHHVMIATGQAPH